MCQGFAIIESMGKRKHKGWVRRMLQVVAGCVIAVALVVAGTKVAMVLMTRDGIVDTEAAADYQADAIVVLGASVLADGTPFTHPAGYRLDRRHRALQRGRRAQDHHVAATTAPASLQRGARRVKRYADCSKGVPSGRRRLRPCGLFHLREHVSGEICVRSGPHRDRHPDVPSLPVHTTRRGARGWRPSACPAALHRIRRAVPVQRPRDPQHARKTSSRRGSSRPPRLSATPSAFTSRAT